MKPQANLRRRFAAIFLISAAIGLVLESYFHFVDGHLGTAIAVGVIALNVFVLGIACDSARVAAYVAGSPLVVTFKKLVPFRPEFGQWFGAMLLLLAAVGCFVYSQGPRFELVRVCSEALVAVFAAAGIGVLVGMERMASGLALVAGGICFFARGGLGELMWYGNFWGIGFVLLCLPIVLATFLYLFIWRNP